MKYKNELLSELGEWYEKNLKILLQISAVDISEDGKPTPRKTALLTARLANEYKKFISEEEKNENETDELLKLLSD